MSQECRGEVGGEISLLLEVLTTGGRLSAVWSPSSESLPPGCHVAGIVPLLGGTETVSSRLEGGGVTPGLGY